MKPDFESTRPNASDKISSNTIAFWALVISIFSLIVSLYAVLRPGHVQSFSPSGYAVIRGVNSFPSDYLVLPLEWQNTSGKPALVKDPELILQEIDDTGKEVGDPLVFTLSGEYPEISFEAFKLPPVNERSFVVGENAVLEKILVFHIEQWWNEENALYTFQFKGGQRYKVEIRYQVNNQKTKKQELFTLEIFERVDELSIDRTKSYWDFFGIK
jgi:hypothetical protein